MADRIFFSSDDCRLLLEPAVPRAAAMVLESSIWQTTSRLPGFDQVTGIPLNGLISKTLTASGGTGASGA